MFWSVGAFGQTSHVQTILERDDFTLEELLDEEDLLQECKSQFPRLVEYLGTPDVIERLVRLVVEPPEDGITLPPPAAVTPTSPSAAARPPPSSESSESDGEDDNIAAAVRGTASPTVSERGEPSEDAAGDVPADDPLARRARHAAAACDVLCCEVDAVTSALVDSEELLDLLWGFLRQDPPLDCTLAGYFGRVVGAVLAQKPNELVQYVQARERGQGAGERGVIAPLCAHLRTRSISDLITRLAGADDAMLYMDEDLKAWLAQDTPLMRHLLDALRGADVDAAQNAAEVLARIARSQPSPMAARLAEPAVVSELMGLATEAPVEHLPRVAQVALSLIDPASQGQENILGLGGGLAAAMSQMVADRDSDDSAPDRGDEAVRSAALQGMQAHLPRLPEILDADPGPEGGGGHHAEIVTTFGVLRPPLGLTRLRTVQLVAALMRRGGRDTMAQLMELGAIRSAVALLGRFPFHCVMHVQVAGMVKAVLDAGDEGLLEALLGGASLIEGLVALPAEVTVPQVEGRPPRPPLRAGYMGHVLALARRLDGMRESSAAVAAALETDAWKEWWGAVVAPRNRVDDVEAWACGRPPASNLYDGSDDVGFHADLSGALEFDDDSDSSDDDAAGSSSDDEPPQRFETAEAALQALSQAGGVSGLAGDVAMEGEDEDMVQQFEGEDPWASDSGPGSGAWGAFGSSGGLSDTSAQRSARLGQTQYFPPGKLSSGSGVGRTSGKPRYGEDPTAMLDPEDDDDEDERGLRLPAHPPSASDAFGRRPVGTPRPGATRAGGLSGQGPGGLGVGELGDGGQGRDEGNEEFNNFHYWRADPPEVVDPDELQ